MPAGASTAQRPACRRRSLAGPFRPPPPIRSVQLLLLPLHFILILDIAHALLIHSCPNLDPQIGDARSTPSRWLTRGYAPVRFEDGSLGWQPLDAHQVAHAYGHEANAEEIATFYRRPVTGWVLARLSDTFAPFFPLSAKEWAADLLRTPNPITSLYLWQTVADTFEHYTAGKQFSRRERQEYLDTLWLFFHHGHEVAGCEGRLLRSLALRRVQRVAAELQRYFHRRRRPSAKQGPAVSSTSSSR